MLLNISKIKKEGEVDNVQHVIFESDKKFYYVIHKPKGYVSSLYDPKEEKNIRNLLKEKLPKISKKLRIAGRLDKDVTGVLILTNDGELINILTSAKFQIKKVYLAKVKGKIQKNKVEDIKKGIIDNGEFLKCEDIKIIFESNYDSILEITMIKGKKHEVKRLIEFIGTSLLTLKRISHGPIVVPNEDDLAEIKEKDLERLLSFKKLNGK